MCLQEMRKEVVWCDIYLHSFIQMHQRNCIVVSLQVNLMHNRRGQYISLSIIFDEPKNSFLFAFCFLNANLILSKEKEVEMVDSMWILSFILIFKNKKQIIWTKLFLWEFINCPHIFEKKNLLKLSSNFSPELIITIKWNQHNIKKKLDFEIFQSCKKQQQNSNFLSE